MYGPKEASDDALLIAMAQDGIVELSADELGEVTVRLASYRLRQVSHTETMGADEIA